MAGPRPLGPLIHSFFADHLITVKGRGMSRRDPLGGQLPDFGPSGWGGVVVVTSSLGYSPAEPNRVICAS